MIGVIDYGAGNIRSISRGLIEAGAEVQVFERGDQMTGVDAIVLPGVGHAGQLMGALRAGGFDTAINQSVAQGVPFLGICVGLQIMFGAQEEGNGHGLGLLPGNVVHLPRTLKTPHMGWSEVEAVRESPIGPVGFKDFFYFVHSYAAVNTSNPAVVATTTYGATFPSVVIQDHLWGCQFHPEKSSTAGIAFLASFVSYVNVRRPALIAATTG
jgi:imidazole glycerol-phosphate synthase subunit HisH